MSSRKTVTPVKRVIEKSKVEIVSELADSVNDRAFTIKEFNVLLDSTAKLNLAFEQTLKDAFDLFSSQSEEN